MTNLTHQPAAADLSTQYHAFMPPRHLDPTSDSVERPHTARGRLGALVNWCRELLADVECALMMMEHPGLFFRSLLRQPDQITPRVAHRLSDDSANVQVGFCDICQVTVEVYGLDGCAAGVNHRVMNIRERKRQGRSKS